MALMQPSTASEAPSPGEAGARSPALPGRRSAPPPRRTQTERRETARVAILETAIGLLAEGGYANMTLADVGERAGYSRSLAAHYFGSKPELLAAIVEHVLADSPPPTLTPGMTGLERVAAELTGLFDGLARDPRRVRAYVVIAHEAATSLTELQPVIHRQNLALRTRIEAAIAQGIAQHTVRSDVDPKEAALAAVAMVRGVTWEWFTDASVDLRRSRRALLAYLSLLAAEPLGGLTTR